MDLAKKKKFDILLVDDDKEFCQSVKEVLERENYNVCVAHNTKDAIFRSKNQKYDCLLIDIVLGPDRGTSLIVDIRKRADSANKYSPILVISGNLGPDIVVEISGKVQGALVKPFNSEAFLSAVAKVCK